MSSSSSSSASSSSSSSSSASSSPSPSRNVKKDSQDTHSGDEIGKKDEAKQNEDEKTEGTRGSEQARVSDDVKLKETISSSSSSSSSSPSLSEKRTGKLADDKSVEKPGETKKGESKQNKEEKSEDACDSDLVVVSNDLETKESFKREELSQSAEIGVMLSAINHQDSPAEHPQLEVAEATRFTERGATGEVVEEAHLPVKQQIAAFRNLEIQETSAKPVLAYTATIKNAPPLLHSLPTYNLTINATSTQQPVASAEANVRQLAEPKFRPNTASFDRPIPLDRRNEPTVISKRAVFSPPQVTSTAVFGTHFSPPKKDSYPPNQPDSPRTSVTYLGPDIISRTTGPPLLIRLRRNGPVAPWGFAVFGGSDYGCPPFISRVTMHSIASGGGLDVGDIIVSICDAPVQGKEHVQLKAEILRAGNELDFMVIKEGINTDILAQRLPHIINPSTPIASTMHYSDSLLTVDSIHYPSGASRPGIRSTIMDQYGDKPAMSRSYRLLDEHLNSMRSYPRPSQPVEAYSTMTYNAGGLPRSSFVVGRTHNSHINGPPEPNAFSTTYTNSYHAASRPPPQVKEIEINANRAYTAAPARNTAAISPTWRGNSSTTAYIPAYNQPVQPPPAYGNRNGVDWSTPPLSNRFGAASDDHDLVTQYYGTQQTSIAKYHHTQDEQIGNQGNYLSSRDVTLNTGAQRHIQPFSGTSNRLPPAGQHCDYVGMGEGSGQRSPMGRFREFDAETTNRNFTSASTYRDQEKWTTSGTVQSYDPGWV